MLGARPLFFLDYIAAGKLETRPSSGSFSAAWRKRARRRLRAHRRRDRADAGHVSARRIRHCRDDRRRGGPPEDARWFAGSAWRRPCRSSFGRIAYQRLFAREKGPLRRHGPEDLFAPARTSPHPRATSCFACTRTISRRWPRFSPGRSTRAAHITGGGLVDNLPRVLPKNCQANIRRGSWRIPPIFQIIQRGGDVSPAEMYQVFNMGIGMVLIVPKKHEAEVARKTVAASLGRSSKVPGLLRWFKAGRSREAKSSPQRQRNVAKAIAPGAALSPGSRSRDCALRVSHFDRHFQARTTGLEIPQ